MLRHGRSEVSVVRGREIDWSEREGHDILSNGDLRRGLAVQCGNRVMLMAAVSEDGTYDGQKKAYYNYIEKLCHWTSHM
jgi:hypothetical protein